MPTCKECSSAVIALAYQNFQRQQNKPRPLAFFDRDKSTSCWMCARFQSWLELKYPELLETCRERPISREYVDFGFFIIRDKRSGLFTFEIGIDVTIEGLNHMLESCQFELYLIPIQGMSALSIQE
jgi:hypothetical protein